MHRPVYDMLQQATKRLSLHMPASQGTSIFEPLDLYGIETTELPVTDDLFQPSGPIREAEELLRQSASSAASFMLQGGSTAGIHAMLLYACRRGDTVILPRNVHLSALNICAVAGINPVFAELSELPGGWLITTPEAYQKALSAYPHTRAAFAVSSDYYGIRGDIAGIANIVHRHGMLLLCDEAHGAYFNWRTDIQNAGTYGADLFVQSAHKTLPAVNAAAWLHAMDGIDTGKVRTILRIVQTSSPSFALMQSMDDARAWMDEYGQEACIRLQFVIDEFIAKASALGFTDDRVGIAADRLRLVLCAPQGGERLREKLQDMGIDVEMSDTRRIVCILSPHDGARRLSILLDALAEIVGDQTGEAFKHKELKQIPHVWPARRMPIGEAMFAETETLKPREAVGRISAVNVGLYPPGVAWVTAGELITDEIADMIKKTPANRLFGLQGGIRCVK